MIRPAQLHPELTVVLPVRNEAAHIADVLAQLCAQTLAPSRYEILVVDGYSQDDTRKIVRAVASEHPHIHLLYNPGITSGSGRNVGALHARAPYILFVDGHCRIRYRTMLTSVLTAFHRGEQCVSRPQPLVAHAGSLFQTAVARARSSRLGHQAGSQIFADVPGYCNPLSAGCGYTRELYGMLGGVDEDFDAGEDLEFNLRVHLQGISAYHDPEFAVGYFPRASWVSLFRQLYRYGYGRAKMARKHAGTFSPLAGLLAVFALWVVGMPLAGVFWPPAWQAWGILAGVYGAVAITHAWRAAGGRWRLWAAVSSCFPAIHLGAGAGYLSGLLGGPGWRQSADRATLARVRQEHAGEVAPAPVSVAHELSD